MRRKPLVAVWLARVCAVLVCGLAVHTPAQAQGPVPPPEPADLGDRWSFIVSPQVWVSHITQNGFAAAPNSALQGRFLVASTTGAIQSIPFPSESNANETVNPQWGIQFAAQKGRWSFATAFQYVTFETRNDLTYAPSNNAPFCDDTPPPDPASTRVNNGIESLSRTRGWTWTYRLAISFRTS